MNEDEKALNTLHTFGAKNESPSDTELGDALRALFQLLGNSESEGKEK